MNYIYVLLLIFPVIGFGLRYFNTRHKRNIRKGKRILDKINQFDNDGAKIAYLRKIDPFVFEELILSAFKNKGYKIIRNKRYTGDGGIDGRVKIEGKLFLVQAKRYSSAINPSHVGEFVNVVSKQCAAGGFFVHTGRTGKKSLEMNTGNIQFISGGKLIDLLSLNVSSS